MQDEHKPKRIRSMNPVKQSMKREVPEGIDKVAKICYYVPQQDEQWEYKPGAISSLKQLERALARVNGKPK